MIERAALEVALQDVRALVAADGGDLVLTSVDDTTAHLTLVLDTVECRECVMPGSFLETVAFDMLATDVPGLTAVVVDDPRCETPRMDDHTMHTARLEDGAVVVVEDARIPVPGDDEALVHIAAAGVCHSDLHLARGDWQGVPRTGLLGHEAIGTVEALGPGADRYAQVGQRVILGLGGTGGGFWCGACEYCLRGLPRHCAQTKGILGTFAEHFAVWAPSLVSLPDNVADIEAPLACGGLTAYGAVKKLRDHRVSSGRRVAIIGAAGGLGHYAVQISRAFGYEVVGVDVGADRLDFVRSLGAEHAVEAADAAAFVQGELGGVDASLVFASRMPGFHLGLGLLRKAGLLVLVGLPPTSDGSFDLNPFHLFMLDPTIVYSAVGTVQDMRELVELAAAGKVTSHVARTGALSELPTIFDELEAGAYTGRAVITDLAR